MTPSPEDRWGKDVSTAPATNPSGLPRLPADVPPAVPAAPSPSAAPPPSAAPSALASPFAAAAPCPPGPPSPPPSLRTSWLGRNRWGLALLPVALVAALVASSDRVQTLFLDEGQFRGTTGAAGQWVTFEQAYTDSKGTHQRRLRGRLVSVRPTTVPWGTDAAGQALTLPPGGTALAVTLEFQADPGMPVSSCSLGLVDAAGTRYDYRSGAGGAEQPVSPCVPEASPGPMEAMGDLDAVLGTGDDASRPATWTVSPVVVVPAGTRISQVRLWWEQPRYLALTVPAGSSSG